MPLPQNGLAWPPAQLAPIAAKHAEWDAWYVGETSGLANVYRDRQKAPLDRTAQYRGGAQGALARMWWGRPIGDLTSRTQDDRTHVPIAADMCQASADLLYAEPPSLTVTGNKTAQAVIDDALDQGLVTVLAEGSEVGAALGDHYLRVTWDSQVADTSFITVVHADAAVPTFRWGRLIAVTFWWVLEDHDGVVVRHLEHHELDPTGVGVIFHGLYEGARDNLGRAVPLTEHPSTAGIQVNVDGFVTTGSPGLAVVHVPNQTPQRLWRNLPAGRNLGRSDLAGVESHMDKLDFVYTSWMRDVRLAKARLIVPQYMLESNGPGRGAFFDDDQDIFTQINQPPREDGATQITPQQFDIRVEQHQATAQQLVNDILRTAGYSRQTFGEGEDVAVTATEVVSKDRRSNLTRDRKIRNAKPALARLLSKKLNVDGALFSSGTTGAKVEVDFVDTTQADAESLARTTDMLFRAQSASVETRVRIAHPDWDEPEIKAEAAAVLAEFSTSVPDPGGFRPGVDESVDSNAVQSVGSQDAGQP